MQKICYYNKHDEDFGWVGLDNTTCCIMSIADDKTVYSVDLDIMEINKRISHEQLASIRRFDSGKGTTEDFNVIKQLANKLNIKLEEKEKEIVNIQ